MNSFKRHTCNLLAGAVASMLLVAPVSAQEGGLSAEEAAKKLNDPNAALSAYQFKFQYFEYEGYLPNADDQSSFDILFQPILPFTPFSFSTEEVTYKMLLRPAIPFQFNQPVFFGDPNNTGNYWRNADFGMGDISFDFDFAASYKSGWLWALGTSGTLPTGTNKDLTGARWRLGPELVLGHVGEKTTVAALLSHQFDLGGWRGNSADVTVINPIFAYLLGGGWSLNSSSVLNYNHRTNDWTIPLNVGVFKTVLFGSTPVKLGAELNYYVKKPDAFAPDWQISFNVTPVLPNPFANLLSW